MCVKLDECVVHWAKGYGSAAELICGGLHQRADFDSMTHASESVYCFVEDDGPELVQFGFVRGQGVWVFVVELEVVDEDVWRVFVVGGRCETSNCASGGRWGACDFLFDGLLPGDSDYGFQIGVTIFGDPTRTGC